MLRSCDNRRVMEGIGESTSAGEASTGAERKAAIERFARIFYDESAETWQTVRWGGVPVYKLPLDLWVMSEIIFETRPALIIETGVAEGGSTLFFANLLDLLGAGRVLSVDTDLSPVDE